jgi:hypothetical protein
MGKHLEVGDLDRFEQGGADYAGIVHDVRDVVLRRSNHQTLPAADFPSLRHRIYAVQQVN